MSVLVDLQPASNPDSPASEQYQRWARRLRQLGLDGLAAAFLQSGGAFAALVAQGLYIGQPLASPWVEGDALNELALLLEHPEKTAAFVRLLQEER